MPCLMRRFLVADCLALLDPVDEPLAVGNGEGKKGLQRLAARRHGFRKIGGDGYLPLLIVPLDLDINDIAHVDAQLPPDAAVHEEAVLPSPTRREIGAECFAPDGALDADVSPAAKRIGDLPRNVDAAVHSDWRRASHAKAVSGHLRLLTRCGSHVLKSLDDASISKRVDLVRRIPELGQHLCGMFGE